MKTVNPSVRNVNLKHRDAEKERVKLMEKDLGGNGAAARHLGPVAAVCYRSGICEIVNSSQCTGSPHGEYTQTLLL